MGKGCGQLWARSLRSWGSLKGEVLLLAHCLICLPHFHTSPRILSSEQDFPNCWARCHMGRGWPW